MTLLGVQWMGTTTFDAEYWRTEPTLPSRWQWSWARSWYVWTTTPKRLPWRSAEMVLRSAGGVLTSTDWTESVGISTAQCSWLEYPQSFGKLTCCPLRIVLNQMVEAAYHRGQMDDMNEDNPRRRGLRWESKRGNHVPCARIQCPRQTQWSCSAQIQLLWVQCWSRRA